MDGEEPKARASTRADLLERLAERLGWSARARTVFGEPVERNGVTVIPVARARWGLGGGGGSKEGEEGGGAGGGLAMDPVGWIEVTDGGSRFRPTRDPIRSAVGLLALALLALTLLRRLLR